MKSNFLNKIFFAETVEQYKVAQGSENTGLESEAKKLYASSSQYVLSSVNLQNDQEIFRLQRDIFADDALASCDQVCDKIVCDQICDGIACDSVICDKVCDSVVCDAVCDVIVGCDSVTCDSVVCDVICDQVCDQICDQICDAVSQVA